jgi:hypothetical protein
MSNTSPDHYKGEIECIAAIKASMSHQQYLGYLERERNEIFVALR